MTFVDRRTFYRVRNAAYGWMKLMFIAAVLAFLTYSVFGR